MSLSPFKKIKLIYLILSTLANPHGRQLWEWTASDKQVIIGQSSSRKGMALVSRPPGVPWWQLFIDLLSVWFNSVVGLLTAYITPIYCKNGITTILDIAVLAAVEAVSFCVISVGQHFTCLTSLQDTHTVSLKDMCILYLRDSVSHSQSLSVMKNYSR